MANEIEELLTQMYMETLEDVRLADSEAIGAAKSKLDMLHRHLIEREKENREMSESLDSLNLKEKELKQKECELAWKMKETELKLQQLEKESEQRRMEFEIRKNQAEHEHSLKIQELVQQKEEMMDREAQSKRESRDRKIQTAATAGLGVLGLIQTWYWTKKAMKFEETGTFVCRTPKFITDLKRLCGK